MSVRRRRGTAAIVGVVALVYGLFHAWYGGSGSPLSTEEAAALIEEIGASQRGSGVDDPRLLASLRTLAESDDGNEFFNVNLIRFRDKASYPAGSSYGDDVDAARERFSSGMVPLLLRRGCVPVVVSEPTGTLVGPAGATAWDQVAVMRYRSRRDFLEMLAEPAFWENSVHKRASVAETHALPSRPVINAMSVRTLVALVLALAACVAHMVLRRAPVPDDRDREDGSSPEPAPEV